MNKNMSYFNYMKRSSLKDNNDNSTNNNIIRYKPDNDIEDERKIIGPSIKNQLGEQNCFLNVLIHTAFNIKEIRNFFLTEEFRKESRLNTYVEFQIIIEKYFKMTMPGYKSNDTTLDPKELRREFAELYEEEQKFQINKMNDPVDLFLSILNSIHSYSTNAKSLKYVVDTPCNPQCISHGLFWINILEQYQCLCGATSEVLQYDYNYFMYEVYVEEIFKYAIEKEDLNKIFFRILKEINSNTGMNCPEKCRTNKVTRNFFLLSDPTYLCFNLIWTGKNPNLLDICKLFTMLPIKFKNDDLFNVTNKAQVKSYKLFGFVCYWSAHYVCFFKSQEGNYWIYYDDTIVTKIDSWKEVVFKCLKSHFHPTILFYKIFDENSLESWRSKEDKFSLFTDEEYSKLVAYCENIDQLNDKKGDYLNDRKSSYVTKVKEHDSLTTSTIKASNNNFERSDVNLNSKFCDKEKFSIPLRENISEIREKDKKINTNAEIRPADDEWICQIEKCRNVNKINTFKCLKCQGYNENIYLLNIQKKDYEAKLNNSIKRRSSVDHIRLPERSSATKLNEFNQFKIQENNIKPINNLNRGVSQSIRQSASLKCDFCKEKNKTKCECSNSNIEKIFSLKNSYPVVGDKYILPNNSSNQINFDSKKIDYSTPSYSSNIKNQNSSRIETWNCSNCKNSNKINHNRCEICLKDKIFVPFTVSFKDIPGYSINNSNSNNLLLRRNTPVKKLDGIRFNEKMKEETRSINNDMSGPNQVAKIFSSNEYKPTIKEKSNKNINTSSTSTPAGKPSITRTKP